jgi:uncharacterized protein (TIGR02186 family)
MTARGLILLVFVLALNVVAPARAEQVVAGLSQTRVALTATFDGSEILVFGAVRRDAPVDDDAAPMQVIVTIQGPSAPLTVWRKARRGGIWVNTDSVPIRQAPSFYAVATSAPFDEAITPEEDARYRVSVPRAIRALGATLEETPLFTEALIRIREEEGVYQLLEGGVEIEQDTLFRTTISLPSSLTEGSYETRIFLMRGGAVIDRYETEIEVRKVGLERALYQLAHRQPVLYGLLAVLIAVASGWAASVVFRRA